MAMGVLSIATFPDTHILPVVPQPYVAPGVHLSWLYSTASVIVHAAACRARPAVTATRRSAVEGGMPICELRRSSGDDNNIAMHGSEEHL